MNIQKMSWNESYKAFDRYLREAAYAIGNGG